ncbi:MAG: hypothetical protein EA401_11725 [Planctomycetota bacterium]|nr:MAG: hypothetical protein EA401_11725 [Planctomycetota bacterium]
MHPKTSPPARSGLWGCLLIVAWLGMLLFTILVLAAGYSAWSQGVHQEQDNVASFGRWLLLAGAACTAILCSSIILIMRLRRLHTTNLEGAPKTSLTEDSGPQASVAASKQLPQEDEE